MNWFAIGTFLVVLFSSIARAEPTPKIRYLMNEPVSLFDLGMDKLDRKLSAEEIISSKFSFKTHYNWEKNRIIIDFSLKGLSKAENIGEAKAWCRFGVSSIRSLLVFTFKNEKMESHLARMFNHSGYLIKNRPDKLDDEIDNITEIIGFIALDPKSEPSSVECKAPLLGKEISFMDEKSRSTLDEILNAPK